MWSLTLPPWYTIKHKEVVRLLDVSRARIRAECVYPLLTAADLPFSAIAEEAEYARGDLQLALDSRKGEGITKVYSLVWALKRCLARRSVSHDAVDQAVFYPPTIDLVAGAACDVARSASQLPQATSYAAYMECGAYSAVKHTGINFADDVHPLILCPTAVSFVAAQRDMPDREVQEQIIEFINRLEPALEALFQTKHKQRNCQCLIFPAKTT